MSKQWLKDHKKDGFYKRAKVEGYRSRAAYKLLELHEKFRIFQTGNYVLDLGAAPGGWSQIAAELVGKYGLVIGVDLSLIQPLNFKNTIFMVGDISDPDIIEGIRKIIYDNNKDKNKNNNNEINKDNDNRNNNNNNNVLDLVISDAAPNISGNYSIDQAKSVYLAQCALGLATKLLAKNGRFVVKVFEGEDFNDFSNLVKKKFRICRNFSPKASRARSSEIYVVGIGFIK